MVEQATALSLSYIPNPLHVIVLQAYFSSLKNVPSAMIYLISPYPLSDSSLIIYITAEILDLYVFDGLPL